MDSREPLFYSLQGHSLPLFPVYNFHINKESDYNSVKFSHSPTQNYKTDDIFRFRTGQWEQKSIEFYYAVIEKINRGERIIDLELLKEAIEDGTYMQNKEQQRLKTMMFGI